MTPFVKNCWVSSFSQQTFFDGWNIGAFAGIEKEENYIRGSNILKKSSKQKLKV